MPKKSKFLTVVFSALPGLGHMYLGWQQRGLFFMLAFFLAIFLANLTGGLLLAFAIPVIWFYSLFDALQCFDEGYLPPEERSTSWHRLFEKQRWIGFGMIALGTLLLLNKLTYPALLRYLSPEVIRTAGISLVALLFIAGGIRLAWGKPFSSPELQEKERAEQRFPLPEEEPPAPATPSLTANRECLPDETPPEEE